MAQVDNIQKEVQLLPFKFNRRTDDPPSLEREFGKHVSCIWSEPKINSINNDWFVINKKF